MAVLHGGGFGEERVGALSRGALFACVLVVAVVALATPHPAGAHRSAAHARSSGHVLSVSTRSGPPGGGAGPDRRVLAAATPVESAAAPAVGSTTAAPAAPVIPAVSSLPSRGGATAYGCGPALAYLAAYAAPGFAFQCPGDAGGHQATTTCVSGASRCSLERLITIADPCAAAYMNEASNSFVVMGLSGAPIDPYGYCR